MPAVRPTGQPSIPRLLERLLAENRISRDQFESAVNYLQRSNEPVIDALIESGAMSEPEALKALAALYRTRFVSTDKLADAAIPAQVLNLLPRKLAEMHLVFPVIYDNKTAALTVVTPDPENVGVLEEVRLVSRVREVKAYVGRPRSVKAAIEKTYGGNPRAFQQMASNSAAGGSGGGGGDAYGRIPIDIPMSPVEPQLSASEIRDQVFEQQRRAAQGPPSATHPGEFLIEAPTAGPPLSAYAPAPPQPPAAAVRAPTFHPQARASEPVVVERVVEKIVERVVERNVGVANETWLETLNVLVSLIENGRQDLRGHSAHVARLTKKLCEKIGLAEADVHAIVAAAYVHDLGKASNYHLTALNVSEYDGHKHAAQKSHQTPARLMEGVRLPPIAVKAVTHMYECFDGKGFPDGLAGKDIPIGARILAITDTYADLTQNPRNPHRKQLRPIEANEVLSKHKGHIFDTNLVDLFKAVITGDDLKAKLLANRRLALLIDSDPEETTVLELRMIEQGFEVKIARTTDQALETLGKMEFELVVSEVELEPFDGFALLAKAQEAGIGAGAAWVFLSAHASREDINRGFELGCVDYVEKPVKAEILVAKLRKIVEQAGSRQPSRGVSGSLEEMSLPDMIQILAQGRKTGALKIRSGGETGEIHFVGGEVFNAVWARIRGEDAFYAALRLRTGDFSLDPNVRAEQRMIPLSTEGLLLEGMRRLDEGPLPPRPPPRL